MRRRRLLPIAAATGICLAASGALAAPTPQALRTGAVVRSGDTVSAVVAVPALLAGRPVPAAGFSVIDKQVALPVRVTALPLAAAELTVVVDVPAANAAQLTTVQGAVSDFLVHLPPKLRVAIVPAGAATVPKPTADRKAALTALLAIRPQAKSVMGPAISGIVAAAAARPGVRSIVLVVSARTQEFGGALDDIPVSSTIYAIVTPGGANSIAGVAALKSLGTATQWRTPTGLLSALDTVTADMSGQYKLEFEPASDSGSVEIAVDYNGIRASNIITTPVPTAVPVPPRPTAPPVAEQSSGGSKSHGKALGGTLMLGIAAIVGWFVVIGIVAVVRQRNRAGGQPAPAAAIDLSSAPQQVIDLTEREQQPAGDVPAPGHPPGE